MVLSFTPVGGKDIRAGGRASVGTRAPMPKEIDAAEQLRNQQIQKDAALEYVPFSLPLKVVVFCFWQIFEKRMSSGEGYTQTYNDARPEEITAAEVDLEKHA
eukprot:2861357-Rhodomonas_salina.1